MASCDGKVIIRSIISHERYQTSVEFELKFDRDCHINHMPLKISDNSVKTFKTYDLHLHSLMFTTLATSVAFSTIIFTCLKIGPLFPHFLLRSRLERGTAQRFTLYFLTMRSTPSVYS